MESQVRQILRVPINVSQLTPNALKVCVEIAEDIGIDAFSKTNLVKYINNSVHISVIGIPSNFVYEQAMQFVKSGIAYWIMKTAKNTDESRTKRQEQIKLYFS